MTPSQQPSPSTRARQTTTTNSRGLGPWHVKAKHDKEKRRASVASRIAQLEHSHWVTHRCERNHVFEVQRTTVFDAARCPTCNAPALIEQPRETALRELRESLDPRILIERMADRLTEWATFHLNAQSWTQRSDDMRQSREKAARGTGTAFGRNPLFQKWR